jgi:hypothetical protein
MAREICNDATVGPQEDSDYTLLSCEERDRPEGFRDTRRVENEVLAFDTGGRSEVREVGDADRQYESLTQGLYSFAETSRSSGDKIFTNSRRSALCPRCSCEL